MEPGIGGPSEAPVLPTQQAKLQRMPSSEPQQPQALTVELLDRRNRQPGSRELLREVRLDAERLDAIPQEVASVLGCATHLYLQHNCFVDTRRLGVLPHLRFLSLAHNNVTEVSGMKHLHNLAVLDLSYNQIRHLDAAELPTSLQVLQLRGNPLAAERKDLVAALAEKLPLLRQVDGTVVQQGDRREPSPESLSSSDGVTNALVEAALLELEQEESGAGPSAALSKQGSVLSSRGSGIDELPSPIRVTPATSRQASTDLGPGLPAEAQEVAARVREALPSLREMSSVGSADGQDITRRSRSTEGIRAFRRYSSEEAAAAARHRATSMPALGDHRGAALGAASASGGLAYPLLQPPPDFATHPEEFQSALVGAISLLVGVSPRGAHPKSHSASLVWQQIQQRRQQVLDSLFAKRQADSILAKSPAAAVKESAADLRRADSTISRQGHRKNSSTINDEMLQGLHARDPPRAEGLSEAMQGPLPAPPGDQLASLSEDLGERSVAESARMSLRCGICKMLEAAQARRVRAPSAEAAVCEELRELKQMASLHSVLAMRDNHASPQPHVLASLLGAHSRLGSITDRLAKVLQVPPAPSPVGKPAKPCEAASSPARVEIDNSGPVPVPSPFDVQPAVPSTASVQGSVQGAEHKVASPFDASPVPTARPQEAPRQFLAPRVSQDSSSGSSTSSAEAPPPPSSLGRKISSLAASLEPAPVLQRRMSGRPAVQAQPRLSPGSDQEADPPRDRQSARPIYGGIAEQLTRGRSAQLEPSALSPGRGRAPLGRSASARGVPMQQRLAPGVKSNPLGGSGALLSLGRTPPSSESEAEVGRPPKGTGLARPTPSPRTHSEAAPQQQPPAVTTTTVHHVERQQQEFQAELWTRFSGGAGSAAKVVQSSAAASPFRNQPRSDQHFTSPFSTFGGSGGGGAISPFSQAPHVPSPGLQPPQPERPAVDVNPEMPSVGDPSAQQPATSPFAEQ